MLWITAALAAPSVEIGLQLHGHAATRRTKGYGGIGASVGYRASRVFAVELAGQFNPRITRERWDAPELLGSERIVRQQFSTQVLALFSPLQGDLVRGIRAPFALDVGVGFGLTQTADDLEKLNVDPSDPDAAVAVDTANQVHPTLAWKAGPRVLLGEHYAFGLYVAGTHWIETIESVELIPLHQVQASASLTRSF